MTRFRRAVTALQKALMLEELPEHAERDAVLLRFELAAELMPKALERVLTEEQGLRPSLPKEIVRAARIAEFATEEETLTLLAIIDDRNRMVHDYSEDFSHALEERVRGTYASAFTVLLEKMS